MTRLEIDQLESQLRELIPALTPDEFDRIMSGETGPDFDDEDTDCELCDGTGIGQHGDPDTSRCAMCGGSGVVGDDDDDPDEAWDARKYGREE